MLKSVNQLYHFTAPGITSMIYGHPVRFSDNNYVYSAEEATLYISGTIIMHGYHTDIASPLEVTHILNIHELYYFFI